MQSIHNSHFKNCNIFQVMTSDGILLNNAISNFDLSSLGEGGGGSASRSANQGFILWIQFGGIESKLK